MTDPQLSPQVVDFTGLYRELPGRSRRFGTAPSLNFSAQHRTPVGRSEEAATLSYVRTNLCVLNPLPFKFVCPDHGVRTAFRDRPSRNACKTRVDDPRNGPCSAESRVRGGPCRPPSEHQRPRRQPRIPGSTWPPPPRARAAALRRERLCAVHRDRCAPVPPHLRARYSSRDRCPPSRPSRARLRLRPLPPHRPRNPAPPRRRHRYLAFRRPIDSTT